MLPTKNTFLREENPFRCPVDRHFWGVYLAISASRNVTQWILILRLAESYCIFSTETCAVSGVNTIRDFFDSTRTRFLASRLKFTFCSLASKSAMKSQRCQWLAYGVLLAIIYAICTDAGINLFYLIALNTMQGVLFIFNLVPNPEELRTSDPT